MLNARKNVSTESSTLGLRRRNEELALILKLGNLLATLRSSQETLEGALSLILEHFTLDAGRIYLLESSVQSLVLAGSRALNPEGFEKTRLTEGFTGKAARTRSFLAQHISELDDERMVKLLARSDFKIVICVPLVVRDEIIGVMNLTTRKGIRLDREKIDLLIAIGNQVAIAVDHARLHDLLKKKERMAELMVYSVSHDLRSPAVGAYGLARLLSKQYGNLLDDKGRSYCRQIMNAAGHMMSLVEDIRSYVSTQKSSLNIEEVNLNEVTKTVWDVFSLSLSERNIHWSEPLALPTVRADRLAIIRVLQNLVDNALKYGGECLSEIKIGCDAEEHFHILTVSDNGVGIKKEDSEHIFELFARGSTSKGTKGSGLGLPIIKEMVEKHHGKIWLQSDSPKGTTFCMTIPKDLDSVRDIPFKTEF